MNGKELFEKKEFIDADLIQDAAIATGKKKQRNRVKWGLTAACISLLVLGILQLSNPENGFAPGSDSQIIEPGNDVSLDGSNFVNVPTIELPKTTNGAAMDMIGLIVYDGRIYTQSTYYEGEQAVPISHLVGDYLGYAKGNIDEWSNQDDYTVEFASTVVGDFYKVKGYDSEFRICMKGQYETEDGSIIEYVHFYDNLNGISLAKGKDLFEDRLYLMNGWDSVKYQDHQNWDNGWPNYEYHKLEGVTNADFEAFLTELYSSEFVDLTMSNIYDKEQGHLYFYMKDGTEIPLRLFEGGYVGYQPLGWYFVKMPGELFDTIYNAIQP